MKTEVDARFADPHAEDAYWSNEQRKIKLEPLVQRCTCLCGGDLELTRRPTGTEDQWPWMLRCRVCGKWLTEETMMRRRKSLTRQFREGAALHPAIANRIENIVGGRPMDSKALMATSEAGMMARIERAKFPQALKPEEKKALALAAITYGFDPLMGELTIFQGRPYVSIDGRYRKAQETGKFDGVSSRPATEAERKEWSIPDGDYFFRAEVQVKGAAFPFVGWGRVLARETQGQGFKPTESNPQRMAEKRAEAQALRKAFSIPLPNAEDIGTENEPLEFQEIKTNPSTGEVIEAECREVPDEAKAKPARPSGLITDAQMVAFKGLDWNKIAAMKGCSAYTSLDVFCQFEAPGGLDALTEAQAAGWLARFKGAK